MSLHEYDKGHTKACSLPRMPFGCEHYKTSDLRPSSDLVSLDLPRHANKSTTSSVRLLVRGSENAFKSNHGINPVYPDCTEVKEVRES